MGDKVITMQMPGTFTVLRVDGNFALIEDPAQGIRLKVATASLRRLGDAPAAPTNA